MNYTKNYHLPQWDENDRIMRVDFNQMCADIEKGLITSAQAAEKFNQSAIDQDKVRLNQMIRMAYNHFLLAQTASPFPQQEGFFFQNAVRDLTGSNAGTAWEGMRCVGSGGGSFTPQAFYSQYATTVSNLKMVKGDPANSSPMMVEIRVPITTRLTLFNIYGGFSGNTPNAAAPVRLTLTNRDTGEVECTRQLNLTHPNESSVMSNFPQNISLYFHVGADYLLKIEPIGNPVYNADLSFGTYPGTEIQNIGGGGSKAFSASYTMRDRAGSSTGLLILHCKPGGPTGRLTVQWDGATVTPAYTRSYQTGQGMPLKEMIYVRNGNIPANTRFSVYFETGEQGSIWFQDWGAILL